MVELSWLVVLMLVIANIVVAGILVYAGLCLGYYRGINLFRAKLRKQVSKKLQKTLQHEVSLR